MSCQVCRSLILGSILLPVNLFTGCKSPSSSSQESVLRSNGDVLALEESQRLEIASKETTCPFTGTAVARGHLPLYQSADNPLAKVEDIKNLGNVGGGNLGLVLQVFAQGNHSFMLGNSGKLDVGTPFGMFSVLFVGSQGSHPGNSGILKAPGRGNPGEGRLDLAKFEEFIAPAKGGTHLKRSQIAERIALNVFNDPNSIALGPNAGRELAKDVLDLAKAKSNVIIKHLLGNKEPKDHLELLQALTEAAGKANLPGSAGEFGLLTAFLAHSPNTKKIDGEPAFSIAEIREIFVNRRFPEGWEKWPKWANDWVVDTLSMTVDATRHYIYLRSNQRG